MCFHKQLHYLVVSAMAHFLAVTNAFICQRWLVFQSTAHWLGAYLRFNVVNMVVLAFSLAGITIMVEVLHRPPLFSQIVIMMAAIVCGYFLNRRFSFGIRFADRPEAR
jgi:putative flippase GtrA